MKVMHSELPFILVFIDLRRHHCVHYLRDTVIRAHHTCIQWSVISSIAYPNLTVFRQLDNWISGGKLFHTTGAHTLKERLAHTVLVLIGTAIKERVDDLSNRLWVKGAAIQSGAGRGGPGRLLPNDEFED